jgi:hypothetical protein
MDLRDYDSGRICEALGWLYGGTFDAPEPWEGHDSFLIFYGSNGARDIYQRTSDGEFFEGNYSCMFGVSKQVAHALEVTAPWEWTPETGTRHVLWDCVGDGFHACIPAHGKSVQWVVQFQDTDYTRIEGDAQDEAAAQSAARAAYRRWMRGGLER